MDNPELLVMANRWGARFGQRPADLLLCDDPLRAALDLAAMAAGDEELERRVKGGAMVIPAVDVTR